MSNVEQTIRFVRNCSIVRAFWNNCDAQRFNWLRSISNTFGRLVHFSHCKFIKCQWWRQLCHSTLHIQFSMTQTVYNQSVNMYALWYRNQNFIYDIQNGREWIYSIVSSEHWWNMETMFVSIKTLLKNREYVEKNVGFRIGAKR